jgi:Carboxypeptidase regulatory-like domain
VTSVKLSACVIALCALALDSAALAQQRPRSATLRIVVHDPSGAVIPGAVVQVVRADAAAPASQIEASSDGQGVAVAAGLEPGRYAVSVSFPGFETRTLTDVRLRAGATKRDVTLAIHKIDQAVSVGRDPTVSASDPNSDRFNTVLSKQQIDALPDDPDEMERVLKEMAGPGATLRVDGFRGGKLPPKSQIRSIRFSRDMFAAENHGGGMVFVDISTQPGLGPLRGGLDFTFRDDSLNARNAFVDEKGPEQTQQYGFNLSGTLLKERTSFSLSAGGASLYDSASIYAAGPDGTVSSNVRRPSDRVSFNGRIDHALTKAHTLRLTFQRNADDQKNLGVGGFDLTERAYARSSDDRLLRLAENGPLSRNVFADSRVQLHWLSNSVDSAHELPTVSVLDAFTAGGAQQAGGRRSTELEWEPPSTGPKENTPSGQERSSKAGRIGAITGPTTWERSRSRAWRTSTLAGPRPSRAARAIRSFDIRCGRRACSSRTTGACARTSRSAAACGKSCRRTSTIGGTSLRGQASRGLH